MAGPRRRPGVCHGGHSIEIFEFAVPGNGSISLLGLPICELLIAGSAVIDQILPPSVAAVEEFRCVPACPLFPAEDALVAAVELSAARACARSALGKLTIPGISLIPGLRGAPRWPEGMIGSVAYCAGYRAAAVGMTKDVVSLGVDAKLNEPLPDDGMLDMVARGEERERLENLAASMLGICWDRLLLSAKLSAYKACFPLAAWWRDLRLADVVIDAHGDTFTAGLLVPGPAIDGVPLTEVRGRWLAYEGLLVTAVVVSPEIGA
jgi:4'-phosphopantetheinyl transferase EntD